MKTYRLLILLAFVLALAAAGLAIANGDIVLSRETVSGGASYSVVGNVAVQATLGQPAIGPISSGEIAIRQGYWPSHRLAAQGYNIYLPTIQTE